MEKTSELPENKAVEIEVVELEPDDLERFEALAMCISPEVFSEQRRHGG